MFTFTSIINHCPSNFLPRPVSACFKSLAVDKFIANAKQRLCQLEQCRTLANKQQKADYRRTPAYSQQVSADHTHFITSPVSKDATTTLPLRNLQVITDCYGQTVVTPQNKPTGAENSGL